MRIKLFQTSDAHAYFDMLAATSQTARAFCARAGVAYESFVGVRRGWQGWHATYNRIPYVFDLLMEGYEGWVLYMDADAYVNDLDFDLKGYLSDKSQYALIAARAGGSGYYWDINIGVLLMNMGHPLMKELAREWYAYLSRYDLTTDTSAWAERISDDQAMLQELLAARPQSEAALLHESWDFFNSHDARFVRQLMRSTGMTLAQRTSEVQRRVAEVMRSDVASQTTVFRPAPFVEAVFQALLGRPADPGSLVQITDRLEQGTLQPGGLVEECLRSEEFAAKFPAFGLRFDLGGRRGLLNDVTQYGELQLLLQTWLDETATARLVVDVGARGRERSNSYDLCKWFGWRALLVEANPELLPGIEADFSGLRFEVASCAVSDYDGRAEFTLGVNDDVSSLEPHMAEAWGAARGKVEVQVRRLPDLLAERSTPERFDLLSLDIEGQDVRVLNDLAQDGRFKPDWVFLEASFNFATKRLEDVGCSQAVLRDYALVGATEANLLLRRRRDPRPAPAPG